MRENEKNENANRVDNLFKLLDNLNERIGSLEGEIRSLNTSLQYFNEIAKDIKEELQQTDEQEEQ